MPYFLTSALHYNLDSFNDQFKEVCNSIKPNDYIWLLTHVVFQKKTFKTKLLHFSYYKCMIEKENLLHIHILIACAYYKISSFL